MCCIDHQIIDYFIYLGSVLCRPIPIGALKTDVLNPNITALSYKNRTQINSPSFSHVFSYFFLACLCFLS